ncbi:MAG TPA: histidine kinase [Pyrinomonadaceae bacterium]|jgi:sensor histidine kinase YesM
MTRRTPFEKWFLFFLCWTALAFVFASQTYIYGLITGEDKDWSRVFSWTLADWYLWAALSPAIFWLAHRFRFERGTWKQALAAHFAAAVSFSLAHIFFQSALQCMTLLSRVGGDSLTGVYAFLLTKKLHLNLLTYAAIVGASHAAFYYRRYHERTAQLARARLHSLQMQLQPHFLFNTLNTISELVHHDPRAADRTIARLGDLLRLSLETENMPEVSLRQELEFLQKYLEIEKTRFHDRLTVDFEIAPETLDARVPSMILQPILENAVRHGIAARPGAGRIEIHAARFDGMLEIKVFDDGAGIDDSQEAVKREGIGLSNTRARLRQLYGERQSLVLENAPGGGSEVTLHIPFRALIGA